MFSFKNLFFLIALLAFSVSATAAQSADFVAPDGSFRIALPNDSASINVVNPSAVTKGGNEFGWQVPQGQFLIGYLDLASAPEGAKQKLQTSGDDLIKNITEYGGKLTSKKDIALDGNPGLEIKFQLPNDFVAITRYYLVKNRVYNLSTEWAIKEDGAAQLKILDSFQLTATKAKTAKAK